MKNKFICCLLLVVSLSASRSFGQGTFEAIASGSWNASGSWSFTGADADGIPDADDTAIIPNTFTISLTADAQIASLTIQNGGTLDMNTNNADLDIVANGGLLSVESGGVISNPISDNNQINFLDNSSFIIDGTIQTDFLDFEGLNQTVTITGAGTLLVGGFSVNNAGVTINLNTTGSFVSNQYQLDVDVPNFTINGTGFIQITGSNGDLGLSSSGLSMGCNMYLSGDIELTANNSSLTVTSGGTVVVEDDIRIGPGVSGGVPGPINTAENSSVTIDNGGTLNIRDDLNFNDEGNGSADNFVMLNNGIVSIGELIELNDEASITITNNNLFTVYGNIISVAAASSVSFINEANATFNAGGAIDVDLTLDFDATGNTVNYIRSDGISQTIRPTTYYHLTLSGSGSKLSGGSITLLGNWTNLGVTFTPGTNTVTFGALAGSATQTISAFGGETFSRLTINSAFETSPQIILNNPVTVTSSLTMTAGNINLNGNSFSLTSTTITALGHSLTSASGWMYGGSFTRTRAASLSFAVTNSRAMFPLGTATDWRPFMVGQTSDANSAGTITVSHDYSNTTTSDVTFAEGITRRHNNFWTLSTTIVGSGATYTLQAGGTTWGTIEAGAAGLADLRMSTSSGVIGTHGASTGGPDYRVNRTAVSFADLANNYHVASTDAINTPLPIELVSFKGLVVENTVQIIWETASELNNDFFTVERSAGGEVFSSIGKVNGAGTTSQGKRYSFYDSNPIYGTAYYRLKQTDFDGTFTYSKIIAITFEGSTVPVMDVYPNPSDGDQFNIRISGLNVLSVPIVMYDQLGRECMRLTLNVDENSGIAYKNFSLEKALPQGIYILKAGPSLMLTKRFVVGPK